VAGFGIFSFLAGSANPQGGTKISGVVYSAAAAAISVSEMLMYAGHVNIRYK